MAERLSVRRLDSSAGGFDDELSAFIRAGHAADGAIAGVVRKIIGEVRRRGDQALLEYVGAHDGIDAGSVAALKVDRARILERASLAEEQPARALQQAAMRISRFARRQKIDSWGFEDGGVELQQRVTPLEAVGIYVPGGKACYPSSVLMNAIPARIAGVERIVAATPAAKGELNPLVAKAFELAGITEVYTMGGAQAVAALAWGTETIAAVKKITGPGNAYVCEAKRQVYGQVGIDMPAGPTEILIISDGRTDPAWTARDLFAQAEHDEMARAMLLCTGQSYLDEVTAQMNALIGRMPRRDIITAALSNRGLFVKVASLGEAVEIANRIAPEHLALSVEDPGRLLDKVKNAGAVFIGPYTSEVLGDYCAGPNHVLPTAGAAHFASALGVYDFQKRINTIRCSPAAAAELGEIAVHLARAEGLAAHAESARCRMKSDDE